TGPVVSQSAFNTGTNNGNVDANDSYVPALPLSASTTPGNATLITTSGVCGNPAAGASTTAPRCGYGPRLPFLVISPWAKENFVDHATTDQTSSLAFIEYNWELGSIDPAPLPVNQGGSFDRLAGSILGMFDFESHPNMRRLLLDERTGTIVGDHGEGGH